MISSEDYEKIVKNSDTMAKEILGKTDFIKYAEDFENEQVERLFWNLLRDYIEGKIPEKTMSSIAIEFEYSPVHHNMTEEARVAIYECIKLEDLTYFNIDTEKAEVIRGNLKEKVKNYFGHLY